MERPVVRRIGIIGVVLAIALTAAGSVSGQDTPEQFQKTCGSQTGLHVDVVGRKSDLLEVWDGGKLIIRDYAGARQSMGGGGISCDDIIVSGDLVVARLGHKDDILHAYSVLRGANRKPYKVSVLVDRFRDGELQFAVHGAQIAVVAGEGSGNLGGVLNSGQRWNTLLSAPLSTGMITDIRSFGAAADVAASPRTLEMPLYPFQSVFSG